ncbi:MAG TPA: S8 family serine peptidase, partial [Xanthomonadaceae bacterium]|nr:S8 family serine peptidase [Xanthomonadaceae bacterium]
VTPGRGGLVVLPRGGGPGGVCGFAEKVDNAAAAGFTGVIIANNVAVPATIVMGALGTTTIPSAMVSLADGNALEAFIATEPTAQADWLVAPVNPVAGQGDVMGAFSSRGPSPFDALKPDVTNPGLSILAAYIPNPTSYAFLQGTSMSSPHTVGSAALLRALHPSWTPMEIKSALMLTSRAAGVVKQDGVTPADPFDRGAGRVDLGRAGVPDLVLNETALRFSQANPATGGDPRTLNVPSYQNWLCEQTCSFTRRVRSVASSAETWNAEVVGPPGLVATVTPSSFTILPGQTRDITVELGVSALPPLTFQFAELVLSTFETEQFTANPGLAIPDNQYAGGFGPGMACSTIDTSTTLPAGTPVSEAWIEIAQSHTWIGDLVIKLGSPDGSILGVLSRPGFNEPVDDGSGCCGSSANMAIAFPLTYRDGAAADAETMGVGLGTANVICQVNGICEFFPNRGAIAGPPNNFGDLAGESATGDWTLCIGDSEGGDTGVFDSWTLNLVVAGSALRMPIAVRGTEPPDPPEITVSVASLSATLAPNQQGDDSFDIGNDGQTDLVWNIAEAPGGPTVILELGHEVPADKIEPTLGIASDPRLHAQHAAPAERRYFESRVTAQTLGGGGPIVLSVDDGTFENGIGVGGSQFVWLNRFTPAGGDFPLGLTQVQVFWNVGVGINVGETFDIYIWEDTDGDGDPGTGAVLRGSLLGQSIQALGEFNTYTLPEGILFDGPGDILIGIVNRTAGNTAGTFPAAIDQTVSQVRSWAGIGYDQPVASPPPLPAPTFGTIDSFGFPGNWGIRGLGFVNPEGCQLPQDITWLNVDPSSGTTAGGGSTPVTVEYDATGLTQGVYTATLCITSNDPVTPLVEIPVELTVVILEDEIFADGFESPPDP